MLSSILPKREDYTDVHSHHRSNIPWFGELNDPECLDRHTKRWGEYDQTDSIFPNKHDAFKRFRSNFQGCHVVPLEAEIKKFEGYMLPKPLTVDLGKHLIGQSSHRRKVPCTQTEAVFPVHDVSRTDEYGDHVLTEPTRQALSDLHGALHVDSRNDMVFQKYPTEVSKKARELREKHARRTRFLVGLEDGYPDFGVKDSRPSSPILPQIPKDSKRVQTPTTPSWLDDCREKNYLCKLDKRFSGKRRLGREMLDRLQQSWFAEEHDRQEDIYNRQQRSKSRFSKKKKKRARRRQSKKERESKQELGKGSYSDDSSSEEEPSEDYHIPCRLGLRFKNDAHKNYHCRHTEKVPDLRDNFTYHRRVRFHGYHTSVFRG